MRQSLLAPAYRRASGPVAVMATRRDSRKVPQGNEKEQRALILLPARRGSLMVLLKAPMSLSGTGSETESCCAKVLAEVVVAELLPVDPHHQLPPRSLDLLPPCRCRSSWGVCPPFSGCHLRYCCRRRRMHDCDALRQRRLRRVNSLRPIIWRHTHGCFRRRHRRRIARLQPLRRQRT